ncbi:unnamed protein product [Caenorhabditis brenneri]
MLTLFLLFLSTPLVYPGTPKCPESFPLHFKRTPTERNNHTTDWCIGVFEMEDMGNRDRARSMCIFSNGSLTIPESKQEFDVIAKHIQARNISNPHAMDGEITPRCKAEMYRTFSEEKIEITFNETTVKGECNVHNHLFEFDDANTDPTYILSNMAFGVPNGRGYYQRRNEPLWFQYVAGCLKLDRTHWLENTGVGVADLSFCVGKKSMDTYSNNGTAEIEINSVLCGRHPVY